MSRFCPFCGTPRRDGCECVQKEVEARVKRRTEIIHDLARRAGAVRRVKDPQTIQVPGWTLCSSRELALWESSKATYSDLLERLGERVIDNAVKTKTWAAVASELSQPEHGSLEMFGCLNILFPEDLGEGHAAWKKAAWTAPVIGLIMSREDSGQVTRVFTAEPTRSLTAICGDQINDLRGVLS